jgi:predicted ABC-type exoprotein transport system permease subunit
LIAQAYTIAYGARFSYNLKISGFDLFIAILMILLPITSEYVPSGESSFWSIIVLLAFLGISIGVMQSSTFNLGGYLPPRYMGAIMLGNGYSAIFINIIRALCLLLIPSNA